jgi:SdrD B-like domain/Domain of unknown function DUF11
MENIYKKFIKKLALLFIVCLISKIGYSQTTDLIIQISGPNNTTNGAAVSYVINISNNGPSAVSGATFSYALPSYISGESYGGCTASGGASCGTYNLTSTSFSGSVDLPANGSVSMTVNFNAPSASYSFNSYSNTASVSAPSGITEDDPSTNVSTVNTVIGPTTGGGCTTCPIVDIEVAKTNSPSGTLTDASFPTNISYSITWTNHGSGNAGGTIISDSYDGILGLSNYYFYPTGTSWSSTGASVPNTTFPYYGAGQGTISATVASWPAGTSITLTYSLVLPAFQTGNIPCGTANVSSSLNNSANYAVPSYVVNIGTYPASVTVSNAVDLTSPACAIADLATTSSSTTTDNLGTCTGLPFSKSYTYTFTNNGPQNVYGALIRSDFLASVGLLNYANTGTISVPYTISGVSWSSTGNTVAPSNNTFSPMSGSFQHNGNSTSQPWIYSYIGNWYSGDAITLSFTINLGATINSGCGDTASFFINNSASATYTAVSISDDNLTNNSASSGTITYTCGLPNCGGSSNPYVDLSCYAARSSNQSSGCNLPFAVTDTIYFTNNSDSINAAGSSIYCAYQFSRFFNPGTLLTGSGSGFMQFPYTISNFSIDYGGCQLGGYFYPNSSGTFNPAGGQTNAFYINSTVTDWPAGATIRIIYTVTINTPTINGCGLALDIPISRPAYVYAGGGIIDNNSFNDDASDIGVNRLGYSLVDLSISKTVSAAILNTGDALSMTTTVQNASSGAISINANWRDTLPDIFINVGSITTSATGWPDYLPSIFPVNYDPVTRIMSQNLSLMPEGASVQINYTGVVTSSLTKTYNTKAYVYNDCGLDCLPITNITQTNFQVNGDRNAVGDYVWLDSNNNGLQETNEPAIPGATVKLYNAGSVLLATCITDANGKYLFSSTTGVSTANKIFNLTLQPGATYKIQVSNLGNSAIAAASSLAFVSPTPGETNALNSGNTETNNDGVLVNGVPTISFVMPILGTNNLNYDFGFHPLIANGMIGNYIWFDANEDGIQNNLQNGSPELLVKNVTVNLYTQAGVLYGTTQSDSSGRYLFTGLPADNYYINIPTNTNFSLTKANSGTNNTLDSDIDTVTNNSEIITLAVGQIDTTWDAGFYKAPYLNIGDPCNCHDILFERNEIYEVLDKLLVTGTPGSKWQITSHTGMKTVDTFFNVVIPFGTYLIEDSAGHYSLEFAHEVGIGYTVTVSDGVHNLTYANLCDIRQLKTSIDPMTTVCGSAPPIALIGFVTKAGNIVAGNVTFNIIKANGDTLFNQTAINPALLTAGDSFSVLALFNPNSPLECPMKYIYRLKLSSPLECAASLGDYVWNDVNKNGVQDALEVGVAGVTITLYNSTTNKIEGATVTDAYGKYLFKTVIPGDYIVGFTLPSNYVFTANLDASGTNPISTETNSDANINTGKTTIITVNYGDSIRSIDAGIYFKTPITTSLGDYVWDDVNNSGLQDDEEFGISGVLVTLYNSTNEVVGSTLTDNTGKYIFKDLMPADYSVGFTAPIGFEPTTQTGVINDGTNSDINTFGRTNIVTLVAGDNNMNVDAGFVMQTGTLASLGDKVWYDINTDGKQDADEAGVPNVMVELYNGSGSTLLKSTKTDALGNYIFNSLAAGSYRIKFITPIGYTISSINTTTDTTLDSNPNTTTGFTNTIRLLAGSKNMTIDAGIFNAANSNSIGDKVWFDENKDGIQDASEAGVGGVIVTLLSSSNTVLSTTTTDANGIYQFAGLPNNGYKVQFSNLPTGTLFTTQTINTVNGSDADPANGLSPLIVLTGGTHIRDIDAGIKASNIPSGTASLGNKVWWDLNNNGLQDAAETGVPNIGVSLLLVNGSNLIPAASTTTDALGNYMFTGLDAGNYYVTFNQSTIPAGCIITTQNADLLGINGASNSDASTINGITSLITLGVGEENLNIDMGILPVPNTSSIGDKVWLDNNKNGLQDASEIGVSGVQVTLLATTGNIIAVTTTDVNGNYLFPNLTSGNYKVLFNNIPTGFVFTTKTSGTANGSDADATNGFTDVIALGINQNIRDVDAGIYSNTRVSLGNYVWLDDNLNGLQDATEKGIAGVLVTLYNTQDSILANAVTDANGYYLFPNLNPGNYIVGFTNKPLGSSFTIREAVASANGSDVYANIGKTGTNILAASQVNLDVDAGVIPTIPASVGDYVWIDDNKNGLQDATEKGVPGVIAQLNDALGNLIGEAVTDGNGKYLFASVRPDNGFKITFSNLPTDYKFTKKVGTILDATNSDADTTIANIGATSGFNLASGQHLRVIDGGITRNTITLTGNVWHDVNGMFNGFVDSSGKLASPQAPNIPPGLRAYLVNPVTNIVLKTAFVNNVTGFYTMNTIEPATFYTVVLSSIGVPVGSVAPISILPQGWRSTGEKLGITAGQDGAINGKLPIPASINNVVNANFGIILSGAEVVIP